MTTYVHLWQYLTEFFLEWEVVSCTGSQNAHFVFNNFFADKRTSYKVVWKYPVEVDRSQTKKTWLMRFSFWVTQNMYYSLFFHSNNCYVNTPLCYVTCSVHLLLILKQLARVNRTVGLLRMFSISITYLFIYLCFINGAVSISIWMTSNDISPI